MAAMTLPQYLIESSICLICFYLFYDWVLKRETFFQFNRFYLLFTALFSLTIPLISFTFSVGGAQGGFNELLLPVITQAQDSHQTIITAVEEPTPFVISIGDIIRVLYFLGVFIMGLKFLDALFKVLQLIRSGHKKKQGNETLVNAQNNVPASSFFSYIFWNSDDENSETSNIIMDHELVHVRQWHSLDVILMEVMVILKWFNPLIYLFRKSLRLTHEYIADRYVSGQMDKLSYANILLTHNAAGRANPLQHTFYSDIKQRLTMLGSVKSQQWKWLKLVGIVPILISLMTLFSFDFTEKLDFVSEGLEMINESYEKIESTAILSIEQEDVSSEEIIEPEETNSEWSFSVENRNDLEQLENKLIFRWGNILEYLPKIENDRPYELSKSGFLNKISLKPTLYASNKYWKEFEFDLLLYIDNIHVYTKRIFVNEDFELTKDEFVQLDFDKVVIDNLILEGSGFSGSFMFARNLIVGESTGPERSPFTSRQLYINGEEFNLLPFFFTNRFPIETEVSISQLITTTLNKDWEIYVEDEKLEDFQLDDYDIFIDVYRDMVIDDSYVMKDSSLPDLIEQTVDNGSIMGRTITESLKKVDFNSSYHRSVIKDWFKTLSNNDKIYITLNDKDGDRLNGEYISFIIKEDNLPYEPKEVLGKKYAGAKLASNYQIIYRKNKRSLVKVDIEDPKNEKIIKAFSDTTKYEVMHIPNFHTDYRIVEYKDELSLSEKTLVRSLPVLDELDIYSLPELELEKETKTLLHWGRMMSMPKVGNFSIKEFHRSRKSQPYIKVDDERYSVVRFTIYVAEKGKEPKAFQSSSIKAYTLNNYLDGIDNEVAIYFDDLIIEKEGEWYHLMNRYSFVFE